MFAIFFAELWNQYNIIGIGNFMPILILFSSSSSNNFELKRIIDYAISVFTISCAFYSYDNFNPLCCNFVLWHGLHVVPIQ